MAEDIDSTDTWTEERRLEDLAPHFRLLEKEIPALINRVLSDVKNAYSILGLEVIKNSWIEHIVENTDVAQKILEAKSEIVNMGYQAPSTNYYRKENKNVPTEK